MSDIEDILIK